MNSVNFTRWATDRKIVIDKLLWQLVHQINEYLDKIEVQDEEKLAER